MAERHDEEHAQETIVENQSPRLSNGQHDSSSDATDSVIEKGRSPSFSKQGDGLFGKEAEIADAEVSDEKERSDRLMRDIASGNPFPEEPGAWRESQFTLRSLVVGCFCGAVIGASDLYLGLKSGNSIGGGAFGAIAGFAILSTLAKVLPHLPGSDPPEHDEVSSTFGTKLRRFLKLGGRFGPKENVTIMCTATAAASNGVAFYGAIPALYQLHLLGDSPRHDYGRLICLSAVCAYWGMFFSVPFRKLYVLDLKLPFPGATANAVTIRTLHTGTGAANNKRRIRALIIAFLAAFVWRVTSEYAPGLMWNHHIFWAFYKAGAKHAIGGDNWTWYFIWSPAFLGVGMIIGGNAAASIAIGQVFAWGIIGPALVASGAAVGQVASKLYPDYVVYTGVTPPLGGKPGSPRYWLLWPGTLLILISTFTELGCNGKALAASITHMARRVHGKVMKRRQTDVDVQGETEGIYDPAPYNERIHVWVWLPGSIIVGIFTVAVMAAQFGQSVATSVLAIVLALLFSFITCEGLGRLAIGVSGIASSVSQLVFLGYARSHHYTALKMAKSNTIAATITSSSGQQTGDMVTDLKVAHLLGASPKSMFYAQCVGAVVSVFLSPSLFILFADVYPCILSAQTAVIATCPYQTPSAAGFRALAGLGTTGLNIPLGAGLFAIFISLFAALTIVAKHFYVPQRYHKWFPSWIAVGLGFMIPFAGYCICFGIGAIFMSIWRRKNPMAAVLFAFPIAAGLISGEGIGGIMTAILQIAGVSGQTHGTTIGCPWGIYCG